MCLSVAHICALSHFLIDFRTFLYLRKTSPPTVPLHLALNEKVILQMQEMVCEAEPSWRLHKVGPLTVLGLQSADTLLRHACSSFVVADCRPEESYLARLINLAT